MDQLGLKPKIFVVQKCVVMASEEDRIAKAASKKRKVIQDEEDARFPPVLKPIVTAHDPCKSRLLLSRVETSESSDGLIDLDIGGTSLGKDDNDGCETPKSEEHQIPEILTCPPAPRKPRLTTKRKGGEFFYVSPEELNLLFSLLKPKQSQVR